MINPTSKMALKMSCLQATNGDTKRAKELYDFLSEDIGEMPDFPPQKPTLMQQVGSAFAWVKDNQQDIVNIYGLLRGAKPAPPIDLPPLINK